MVLVLPVQRLAPGVRLQGRRLIAAVGFDLPGGFRRLECPQTLLQRRLAEAAGQGAGLDELLSAPVCQH